MFVALGPLRRSKAQRLLLLSESRLLALRLRRANVVTVDVQLSH